MDPRVLTEIRPQRRGSKRRSLLLDDEPWRSLPVEVLRELGLRPGDAVDTFELDAKIDDLEPRFARERCLRLLSVRERTESELLKRLLEDGYSEDVARETVARLAETGLVDDSRFAETMARVLIDSRRLGRSRAFRELTRRGIDEEMAAAALDAYAPRDAESARALESAQRLLRANDTVPRLASRLVRRGFAPGEAFTAARSVVPTTGDDATFEEC